MVSTDVGSLHDVIERTWRVAEQEDISVGDLLDALGSRSFAPLLLLPAFLAATPLSGIPGVSIFCGLLIAVISLEMLASYEEAYVPERIRRQQVPRAPLQKALIAAAPVISWIDSHTRRRLTWLFHRPVSYLPKVVCLLSGLAMPFLEFVPFSSSIVAAAVSLLAISLLTRDGLFLFLGLVPYAALLIFLVSL